jgi:hypothetical protein
MRVPPPWRRWRRGTPRNASPNCANDPKGYGYRTPAALRAGPGSGGTSARSGQPENEIIFLCEDDEDDANEISPTIEFILPKGDTNEA